MSGMARAAQSVFNHFRSPVAKRTKSIIPMGDSETKSNSMPHGIKRKADPYDIVDDENATTATPSVRSRRSSQVPSSVKSKGSTKKTKRQSVGKQLPGADAAPASPFTDQAQTNNKEETCAVRAPMADMGSAELLEKNSDVEAQRSIKDIAKAESAEEKSADEKVINTQPIEKDHKELTGQDIDETSTHEIKALAGHKEDTDEPGRILIHVQWQDGPDNTWEPEEEIQEGASEMLFDYWKKLGGRSTALFDAGSKPRLQEQYWAYKILDHERDRSTFRFQVQWVGYPADNANTTWETELKMKSIAKGVVDEYWDSKGGRDQFLSKRGRAKKARTS